MTRSSFFDTDSGWFAIMVILITVIGIGGFYWIHSRVAEATPVSASQTSSSTSASPRAGTLTSF